MSIQTAGDFLSPLRLKSSCLQSGQGNVQESFPVRLQGTLRTSRLMSSEFVRENCPSSRNTITSTAVTPGTPMPVADKMARQGSLALSQ